MGIKTLEIEVPNGYEIDQEKSTFENIVFKKVDDIIIKWNRNHNGVEIKADGEHFVLDSNPSYIMNWDDSIRFYNNIHRSHTWNLPTVEQLQIVYKYFDEINNVIKDNGGFVLYKSLYLAQKSESCECVNMCNGYTRNNSGNFKFFVRAVSNL